MIRLLVVTTVAVLLHLLLGWEWTILAGVGAGMWFEGRGWIFGALAVGLDWLALVVFSFSVDSRAVGVMTYTMGRILGNLPSPVIVAITLLIGMLIGGLGGAAGTQLRRIIDRHS